MPKTKRTFEEWMKEVDRILLERVFMTHHDLQDIDYRSLYESGTTPKGAASQAIKNAQES